MSSRRRVLALSCRAVLQVQDPTTPPPPVLIYQYSDFLAVKALFANGAENRLWFRETNRYLSLRHFWTTWYLAGHILLVSLRCPGLAQILIGSSPQQTGVYPCFPPYQLPMYLFLNTGSSPSFSSVCIRDRGGHTPGILAVHRFVPLFTR